MMLILKEELLTKLQENLGYYRLDFVCTVVYWLLMRGSFCRAAF